MHTFLLGLTWDTGHRGLSWSSHMQYHEHVVRISCTHMYSASRSAATLSEIVACRTLLLLLHLHTHCMSGQAATGYSYQLIFLKDKSVPSELSTANYWHDPIQASQRQSEQMMMRVVACDPLAFFFFLFFFLRDCIVPQSVKSGGLAYDMSH